MSSFFRCSFCGKGQDEVLRLIAGPEVYICDECVDLCNEVLDDAKKAQQEEYEKTNWIFKL